MYVANDTAQWHCSGYLFEVRKHREKLREHATIRSSYSLRKPGQPPDSRDERPERAECSS